MSWLYRRIGPLRFASSEFTRTGWNDHDQHGGPPSALLAHVIQHAELPVPMHMSRITVSLMRPVPIADLEVTTRVVRAGRRVAVVEAGLVPDGSDDPVATAQAQLIRTEEIPLDELPRREFMVPGAPTDHPEAQDSSRWADGSITRFHRNAVEKRSVDGGWERLGPGQAWFRMTADLVEGEPHEPTSEFIAIADMANGLSSVLDGAEWVWVNPDLTVAFSRPPTGEWMGMEAVADPQTHGVGLVHATAFDQDGTFGHVLQSQLLTHLP
ncbi:MAG: thioesterase family protein [Acidimicrobiia bacterium]|nr:MAG: thioesterase family protein [Acidimicrobiia bacterium]